MTLTETPLPGVYRVALAPRADERGAFARTYCAREFATQAGWHEPMVQANQSWNPHRGTLRGMHFQHPPHGEGKYVRCLRGALWDVAVDLRPGSPTYLQHTALELTADNGLGLLIPAGMAHGFITLAPDTIVAYMHTAYYAPGHEGGLHYADPALSIPWPMAPTLISDRDAGYAFMPR